MSDSYRLGFIDISPELSEDEIDMIDAKADEILDQARKSWKKWLDENGYENAMGIIIKKGEVK